MDGPSGRRPDCRRGLGRIGRNPGDLGCLVVVAWCHRLRWRPRREVCARMTTQRLTVGRHRFDAVVEGRPDGDVVVLLHGWPQTPACWDAIAPVLAERGRYVVAPAQRGYSPGARPRSPAAYRLDHLVGDVVGVADALAAERVDVVGH